MIRVRKYSKGWICEWKEPIWGWFGLNYKWSPITKWAGVDKPYYYKTPEEAREVAFGELQKEIHFNFHFNN